MAEINVVPYIDVMLVLLVIFMVTAPLLTEGVKVDLPQAHARPVDENQPEPFQVVVDREGKLYLNEERNPTEAQRVMAGAAAVLRRAPKTNFVVRGDREVRYEAVIQAMALLQQAGVPSVGLVTESPPQTKR
jgi:biopolymer transport protein TolR